MWRHVHYVEERIITSKKLYFIQARQVKLRTVINQSKIKTTYSRMSSSISIGMISPSSNWSFLGGAGGAKRRGGPVPFFLLRGLA
jgi:hypothetical protein